MAPKRRRQPQAADLLEKIRDEIDEIASRVHDANTIDLPAALLGQGEHYAQSIQQSAEQLLKSAQKLVKTIKQKKRLSCSTTSLQQIDSNGHYTGRVKIGLAQLKHQTVPTISKICSDFKLCNSLGYFTASVGKDVLQDIDLQKVSGSSVKVPKGSQSKSVYLSPRNEQDNLHGFACFSLVAQDKKVGKGKERRRHSEFHVPDLSWRETGLDPRELLCSTVQNAREDDEQPYLVIPTESSSHWLESIGLCPYLLDCGEQLKKTAGLISGVHTPYLYISGSPRSSSPLHVEDAFLGSINLVIAGAPKVWLIVEPRFRAKLEERVRQHLVETDLESEEEDEDEDEDDDGEDDRQDDSQDDDLEYDGPCSQFVRHQSSLLSPKLLDSWRIPYRIVVCKAGQMMVTLPGAYHEVVNAGPNMAMAINFASSDWTGPPESYRFCRRRLHRIKPADLCISQEIRSPSADDAGQIREEPDRSSRNSLIHQSQEEEISDQQRDGLSRSSPSPQLQEEEEISDQQDESPHTSPSPRPQGEDTSDKQDGSSCSSPSYESHDEDETEERLDELSHNSSPKQPQEEERPGEQCVKPSPVDRSLYDQLLESSIATTLSGQLCNTPTPLKASATTGKPDLHSLMITPAMTTISESETQQCSSVTSNENAGSSSSIPSTKDGRCGDSGNPIDIPSDENDEVPDTVQLSIDEPCLRKIAAGTFEARLDTLIKSLLPVTPGFQCSEETIKRFGLGSQLNDEAIMLMLQLILPKEADPLIASFAIRNRPTSLCRRYTEPDVPRSNLPILKHNLESTYLFIACNVEAGSLECNWTVPGNHWILIVVDFDEAKVHVFGTEGGHKVEAEAIAYNIELFVNNYRKSERLDPVGWSSLETHPLYPTGSFPDNYNCGVAVISRAESFLYPDKALSSSSDVQLSNQLNELRVDYLRRILRRCTRVARDEKEKLTLLTPESRNRKRSIEFLEGTSSSICVKAVKLTQRTASSPSPLATIPKTDIERWQECLCSAADRRGFYARDLLEAFKRAPDDQGLDKVVRVLQYVCEVANAETLLQLKGFLLEPTAQTEEIGQEEKELVNLHTQIRRYKTVSFMAQAEKLICQLFYYDWFQVEANKKRVTMHAGRKENKRITEDARRKGLEAPQRNASTDTALVQQRKYAVRLITSSTKLDEASVHADVNNNYHKGEILNFLLSPGNGEERWEARFMYLLPLYDRPDRPPLLDINAPGTTKSETSKKISTPGFWRFINIPLAKFFGEALSIVRPELHLVESYLPIGGLASQVGYIHRIDGMDSLSTPRLLTMEDEEIRRVKPQDVARLLKPISSPVEEV